MLWTGLRWNSIGTGIVIACIDRSVSLSRKTTRRDKEVPCRDGSVTHSTRWMPCATPSNQVAQHDCRACGVPHHRCTDARRVPAARRRHYDHNAQTVLGIAPSITVVLSPLASSPSRQPQRSQHTTSPASTTTSSLRLSVHHQCRRHKRGRLHHAFCMPVTTVATALLFIAKVATLVHICLDTVRERSTCDVRPSRSPCRDVLLRSDEINVERR